MTTQTQPRRGGSTPATRNGTSPISHDTSLSSAPVLPPPKRQRRPAVLVAGVLLVALGAIAAYALAASSSQRTSVIAVAADVAWGQTIAGGDLVEVHIVGDPGLRPIAWADRDGVIGQLAANDLHPGSLLTTADLTDELIPAEGQSLVGVAVKPGYLPATTLVPGLRVSIVSTDPRPAAIGDDVPLAVPAVVYTVGEPDPAGGRTVDVLVDETEATVAATWSAGEIAAIIVVPGR